MKEMRIVAVNGCLGYGFDAESLAAGVDAARVADDSALTAGSAA